MIRTLRLIFYEMRSKQYTKNAFVFIAPLFVGNLLQLEIALKAKLAFVAFSCVASVVYVIEYVENDGRKF